jgi:hypothetical protein
MNEYELQAHRRVLDFREIGGMFGKFSGSATRLQKEIYAQHPVTGELVISSVHQCVTFPSQAARSAPSRLPETINQPDALDEPVAKPPTPNPSTTPPASSTPGSSGITRVFTPGTPHTFFQINNSISARNSRRFLIAPLKNLPRYSPW